MIDKQAFIQECIRHLREKLQAIEGEQSSLTADASAQGKSTAGDKHDTAMAMAHLAQEQNNQLLLTLTKQLQIYLQPQWRQTYSSIAPGSFVITDQGHYFILQAIGNIVFNGHVVHTLSIASPLGQKLLHKKAGDQIELGDRKFAIQGVV